MSYAEDQFVELLKRQSAPMKMTGIATGQLWIGLNTLDGPFRSTRRASEIIRAVLYVSGVNRIDFMSHRRWRSYAEARQVAYWFMRNYTMLSTTQIGRFIGDRDHATILHGIKRVNAQPWRFASLVLGVAKILNVKLPEEIPFQ